MHRNFYGYIYVGRGVIAACGVTDREIESRQGIGRWLIKMKIHMKRLVCHITSFKSIQSQLVFFRICFYDLKQSNFNLPICAISKDLIWNHFHALGSEFWVLTTCCQVLNLKSDPVPASGCLSDNSASGNQIPYTLWDSILRPATPQPETMPLCRPRHQGTKHQILELCR
jgi:hypothetical protein